MKKFFGKIVSFLTLLFTNLDAWIHEHVQPAIETVNVIKHMVENPLAQVITNLIPGNLDDKIRAWIITNISKAISLLNLGNEVSQVDFPTALMTLVNFIRSKSLEERKGLYMRLAVNIAKSSGEQDSVKGHSIDLLTQLQYSKAKEKLEASDLPESKYTAKNEVALTNEEDAVAFTTAEYDQVTRSIVKS